MTKSEEPEKHNSNLPTRRRFIQAVGASSFPIVVGNAKADETDVPHHTGETSGSIKVTEEDGMEKNEAEKRASQIARKYDGVNPREIVPSSIDPGEVRPTGSSIPSRWNLTHVRSYDNNPPGRIYSNQTGVLLAETNHMLTLYEGNETDNRGRRVYFFWHWSQCEGVSNYRVQTEHMRNHVDLRNNNHILSDFAPSSPLTVEGRTYNIGLSVGYKGVSMGVSTEYTLGGGEIKAETSRTRTGRGGEFSIEFKGCNDGTTNLNGASVVYSDSSIWRSHARFNYRAAVNTTLNCFL